MLELFLLFHLLVTGHPAYGVNIFDPTPYDVQVQKTHPEYHKHNNHKHHHKHKG